MSCLRSVQTAIQNPFASAYRLANKKLDHQLRVLFYSWASVLRHSDIHNSPKFERAPKPVRLGALFVRCPWMNWACLQNGPKITVNHIGRFYFFTYKNLSSSSIYPPQTMRSPQIYLPCYGSKSETIISRALNIYCPVTQDKAREKKRGRAVPSYLRVGASSQTTVAYYFMGLRPHSEISGLKFGLKEFAKSDTSVLMVQN